MQRRLSRAEYLRRAKQRPGRFERSVGEPDDDTDYEPDAVVNRGARLRPDDTVAGNPVTMVEMLSPATRSIDGSHRLFDHFPAGSIRHCLILPGRRPELLRQSRVGTGIVARVATGSVLSLDPPGIAIDVGEVYAAAG